MKDCLQRFFLTRSYKNEMLRKAVAFRDLHRVNHAISIGADRELKLLLALAALSDGIQSRDLDAIRFAMQIGADEDQKGELANAALFEAVHNRSTDTIRFAIAIGADLEATNANGQTPLHSAARMGDEDIMKLLMASGCCINAQEDSSTRFTPLHLAVERNHTGAVRTLLKAGAQIDPLSSRGRTPLYYAVSHQLNDIVELLLSNGADANAQDSSEESILGLAAQAESVGLIRLLISNGANIVRSCHDAAAIVLTRQSDLNTTDALGDTPLHLAVSQNHETLVRLLLTIGADPNIRDKKRQTPLHIAAAHGQKSIVKLLLNRGAGIEAKSMYGETPLLVAARARRQMIVKLLQQHGANEAAEDDCGNTWTDFRDWPTRFPTPHGDCWSFSSRKRALEIFNGLRAFVREAMTQYRAPTDWHVDFVLWQHGGKDKNDYKLLATAPDYRPATDPRNTSSGKRQPNQVVIQGATHRIRVEIDEKVGECDRYETWNQAGMEKCLTDCNARMIKYMKITSPLRDGRGVRLDPERQKQKAENARYLKAQRDSMSD